MVAAANILHLWLGSVVIRIAFREEGVVYVCVCYHVR